MNVIQGNLLRKFPLEGQDRIGCLMLKYKWKYNKDLDTWFFGSANNGGGVFITEDGVGWTGNVVFCGDIYCLDISASKEDSQLEAENLYEELNSIYGE